MASNAQQLAATAVQLQQLVQRFKTDEAQTAEPVSEPPRKTDSFSKTDSVTVAAYHR
jgi:hypothetical protein